MSSPKKTVKAELPLTNDAEVRSLVERFEQRTLPYEHWTHRAHLAVAISYVQQFSFDDALTRIRNNIQTYNRECGDPNGYHETITVAFLKKISAEHASERSKPTIHEEVARVAQICTIEWLHSYYSKDVLSSADAKIGWIPPDLADADF